MIRSLNQTSINRRAFQLSVGAFVLLSAFLYGISAGLARNSSKAHAKFVPFMDDAGTPIATRLALPAGVSVSPLGREVTINDHPAEIVSFVSSRPAADLINEQIAMWKTAGMKAFGKSGGRRGIALGFNEATGERFSFSAWTVPPQLRAKLSGGSPTQGFMSVSDSQQAGRASDGTVPDVPLKPGGKAGAVFSAVDPGGRTYTGAYTLPGTIGENIEYYRAELGANGWRELNAEAAPRPAAGIEVGNTIFQQGGEEIVLLFTPLADANDARTVVSVTRGPINIERWRGLE